MQISLALFLAWAVVGGAWAWSSSEVSCASCGSECQSACGTRNFRACCFNFQRRRRSMDGLSLRSQGLGAAAEWKALRGALRLPGGASRGFPVAQFLEAAETDPAPRPQPRHREAASLASVLNSLLQESAEDEDDMLELEGEGGGEGIPEGGTDDATLSRLVALALHQPPPPPPPPRSGHQHYPAHPPPPPPPAADVGK